MSSLPLLASVALGEDSCSSGSRKERSLTSSSESIVSHQDCIPVLLFVGSSCEHSVHEPSRDRL